MSLRKINLISWTMLMAMTMAGGACDPSGELFDEGIELADDEGDVVDDLEKGSTPLTCADFEGGRRVLVADADALRRALSGAKPGDVIALAPGTYRGNFVLSASGAATARVVLCGDGPEAVTLDNARGLSGYTLQLKGVRYATVAGMAVRGGDKTVIVEHSSDNLLANLDISGSGQEGIHFWNFSSRNTLRDSTVHDTGVRNAGTGEGIYIGRAKDKWAEHTEGKPDKCDGNRILYNRVWNTTAECIDVKEGTTGGKITGNQFDGKGLSGEHFADSWLALKGNGYLVSKNTGKSSLNHGIEIQFRYKGFGQNNVIRGNTLEVNAPGYGVMVQEGLEDLNLISCDNRVIGARSGFATVKCRDEG